MKRLICVVATILAVLVLFPSDANAGWVKGHWKDGNYVSGYWKSNPNGLKYDNYSFDGDWSDAFNDSYFSPTRNYSSNWYTPSWLTQDDYYIGQSFYNSRNNYSSFDSNLFDYDYDFRSDPIYDYTPSYDYGYDTYDWGSGYNSYDSLYSPYGSYNLYDYSSPSYCYSYLYC